MLPATILLQDKALRGSGLIISLSLSAEELNPLSGLQVEGIVPGQAVTIVSAEMAAADNPAHRLPAGRRAVGTIEPIRGHLSVKSGRIPGCIGH